ncbi:MAG: hypothetical protein IPF98_18960 [Gemmatimonadetes bacterium]|nr:hypothetical protein [Gemmatimonadota bacterium]
MTLIECAPPLVRHRGRIPRCVLRVAWGMLAVSAAFPALRTANAQDAATPPAVRTLLGDVALILRAEGPQSLRIGVAGAARAMSLVVLTSDARRWADSATVLLAPQRPPSVRAKRTARDGIERSRVILEEPGVGAGSFMLTRVDSAGTRRFLLFADDSALSGIRQTLALDEARLLVRLVRRAATPSPPRRPPARKGTKAGKAPEPPAPGRSYPR